MNRKLKKKNSNWFRTRYFFGLSNIHLSTDSDYFFLILKNMKLGLEIFYLVIHLIDYCFLRITLPFSFNLIVSFVSLETSI